MDRFRLVLGIDGRLAAIYLGAKSVRTPSSMRGWRAVSVGIIS